MGKDTATFVLLSQKILALVRFVAHGLAAVVLFLDAFALVVHLLTTRQGNVEFGIAVFVNPHASGDDGHAALVEFGLQLLEFLSGKQ